MKFLIVFVLAFATVRAKDLHSRSIEVPVLKNQGRITNGQNAAPGKFKYQVGLSLTKGVIMEWCGGSLIGKKWILSAAHCTLGASSAVVFLGTTKRSVADKIYNTSKDDFFTHPAYNPNINENNIALIRVPTTSESSEIGIVRIPSNEDKHVGNSVVVSGWGLTSDTSNDLADNLQYGILKVSPDNLCSEVYGPAFSDRTNICVATPNKVSTCRGDYGAPLVLEGQNLQIGLFSHGSTVSCAEGSAVLFTRVGIYRFWIRSLTGITGISNL